MMASNRRNVSYYLQLRKTRKLRTQFKTKTCETVYITFKRKENSKYGNSGKRLDMIRTKDLVRIKK